MYLKQRVTAFFLFSPSFFSFFFFLFLPTRTFLFFCSLIIFLSFYLFLFFTPLVWFNNPFLHVLLLLYPTFEYKEIIYIYISLFINPLYQQLRPRLVDVNNAHRAYYMPCTCPLHIQIQRQIITSIWTGWLHRSAEQTEIGLVGRMVSPFLLFFFIYCLSLFIVYFCIKHSCITTITNYSHTFF